MDVVNLSLSADMVCVDRRAWHEQPCLHQDFEVFMSPLPLAQERKGFWQGFAFRFCKSCHQSAVDVQTANQSCGSNSVCHRGPRFPTISPAQSTGTRQHGMSHSLSMSRSSETCHDECKTVDGCLLPVQDGKHAQCLLHMGHRCRRPMLYRDST